MTKIICKIWLLFSLLLFIFTISDASLNAQTQNQSARVIIITDLVVVDAQVVNKKTRRVIGNLEHEDFELYEDGVKQEITHFNQQELPLSILLLFDVGSSLKPIIERLQAGALQALQNLKSTVIFSSCRFRILQPRINTDFPQTPLTELVNAQVVCVNGHSR
ncbi:MAG TPA: hypothetical protein VJ810_33160 [Blastocatellia bacterium]|nr:hypothetical protein [Blastocatellia bacterium]